MSLKNLVTIVLSMLFAATAVAGNLPQASSQVGYGGNSATAGSPSMNVPISDAENEIALTACKNAATNTHLFKLYKSGTGAQYAVTASKHFVVHSMELLTSGTANADGFQFLSGTADLSQDDDTTGPSGVVWAMGASGKPQFYASQLGDNSKRYPVCYAQNTHLAAQFIVNTGTPNMCLAVVGREYTGSTCP